MFLQEKKLSKMVKNPFFGSFSRKSTNLKLEHKKWESLDGGGGLCLNWFKGYVQKYTSDWHFETYV